MNGLLLNEHRMFNECAKQYAIKHFQRDYQSMKTSIQQFVEVCRKIFSIEKNVFFSFRKVLVKKKNKSIENFVAIHRTVLFDTNDNSIEFLRFVNTREFC